MEHFYQDINGFMSQKNTVMLDMALTQFPVSGTWVELGSWNFFRPRDIKVRRSGRCWLVTKPNPQ